MSRWFDDSMTINLAKNDGVVGCLLRTLLPFTDKIYASRPSSTEFVDFKAHYTIVLLYSLFIVLQLRSSSSQCNFQSQM